jgi:hypothetical protein
MLIVKSSFWRYRRIFVASILAARVCCGGGPRHRGVVRQFRSGAAKVVLEPDNILDSGDMTGRSRLEVVNPEAAKRLSATGNLRLTDLLPPAPQLVDPPADHRPMPDPEDLDVAAQLEQILSGDIDLKRLIELLPPVPMAANCRLIGACHCGSRWSNR